MRSSPLQRGRSLNSIQMKMEERPKYSKQSSKIVRGKTLSKIIERKRTYHPLSAKKAHPYDMSVSYTVMIGDREARAYANAYSSTLYNNLGPSYQSIGPVDSASLVMVGVLHRKIGALFEDNLLD